MALNEDDLILLESYLDDELTPAEEDDVRAKLADEEWASALKSLREHREMRAGAWDSLEPAESEVETVIARIDRAAAASDRRDRFNRFIRFTGAAAAVLVVGFSAGWMGHQRYQAPLPVAENLVPANSLAGNSQNSSPYDVVLTNDSGQVLGTQKFRSQDEAVRFKNDVNQLHSGQQRVRDGRIQFISSEY